MHVKITKIKNLAGVKKIFQTSPLFSNNHAKENTLKNTISSQILVDIHSYFLQGIAPPNSIMSGSLFYELEM